MSNQYEIEHNIKTAAKSSTSRRPDMSSFTAFLDQISTPSSAAHDPSAASSLHPEPHNNPHATPTPVDVAALFRLVQEQFQTLFATAPTDTNRAFLEDLIHALEADIDHPPDTVRGVDQAFLDGLDRVNRKTLKKDDTCPICAERFLDDKYPLVVELPCHRSHRFDLECVAPWLQSKGTCPMCRKEMMRRDKDKGKTQVKVDDDDEEEDPDMLYA